MFVLISHGDRVDKATANAKAVIAEARKKPHLSNPLLVSAAEYSFKVKPFGTGYLAKNDKERVDEVAVSVVRRTAETAVAN